MFTITFGKGFHIQFPNGVTLSTQIGAGNYCKNRDNQESFKALINPELTKKLHLQCNDCEVAVWDKEGDWILPKYSGFSTEDTVAGYVEIDEWLKLFDWCRNYEAQS